MGNQDEMSRQIANIKNLKMVNILCEKVETGITAITNSEDET